MTIKGMTTGGPNYKPLRNSSFVLGIFAIGLTSGAVVATVLSSWFVRRNLAAAKNDDAQECTTNDGNNSSDARRRNECAEDEEKRENFQRDYSKAKKDVDINEGSSKIDEPTTTIPLPRLRVKANLGKEDEKVCRSIDEVESATEGESCNPIPSFTLISEYDNIYQTSGDGPKPFQFNRDVVRVFDDMISRSVPLYRETMVTLLHWVAHYYQPKSTQIYDLGCSTGTTLDFIARSFFQQQAPIKGNGRGSTLLSSTRSRRLGFRFVGIDNSEAMIEKAKEKLSWITSTTDDKDEDISGNNNNKVNLIHGDLMKLAIIDASIVIMNYTLQFIPVHKRLTLLSTIYDGLCDNGILFLSEKVRSNSTDFQETCTNIYEDFKYQRGYTQTEIARKKEALMNVLIPHTEEELMDMLLDTGFHHAQVVVKWNNFTTIVAIKKKASRRKESIVSFEDRSISSHNNKTTTESSTSSAADASIKECENIEHMEALFEASPPLYLNMIRAPTEERRQQAIHDLLKYRDDFFHKDLKRAAKNFGPCAKLLRDLPDEINVGFSIRDNSTLQIGSESDLSEEQLDRINKFMASMKPWKKGPINLFGTQIETEWRSDWKWKRLVDYIDPLDDHVVCDLGCANGYFMFRMLDEFNPKLVVGIDPNYKAWLEFQCFQKFAQQPQKLVLELMDGDCMDKLVEMFDTVFCLGVLYHTTDPIGMLRKIYTSMKPGGQLIVDCQGIPGDDPVALFPKGRYTNAKGFWFLPTITTLQSWLTRTNFGNGKMEVFFSEKLSTEEQKSNSEWANMKSLHEGLDPKDHTKTKEGYPAPYRFYVKCYRN